MNFLKRLTYRTEVISVARWLGLRAILRKLYFWWARPKNGILSLELAGVKARYYVRTPDELRILESAGGAGGEQKVVAEVLAFLQPGDVVFDIGANVGLYTVLLSKTVGKSGRVFAFEPEPETCAHLQDNLKLNAAENVKWFRKALGERTGRASLFTGGIIGGGSLVHHQGDGQVEQTVDVVQGDELVMTEHLPIPRAVKIDVEGYEHSVIEGLRHTLADPACQMICCEIHPSMLPPGVSPEAVLSLVDSVGFRRIQQFPRWDRTFHIVGVKAALMPSGHVQAN
jgi:FkbM family methyltransferase